MVLKVSRDVKDIRATKVIRELMGPTDLRDHKDIKVILE